MYRMGGEINKHHPIHERRSYTTYEEKRFRNGIIVPMYVEAHRDLHGYVDAPPKPTREQILGALAMIDDLPHRVRQDPVELVQCTSDYFLSDRSALAQAMGENLARQLVFIEHGAVRPNTRKHIA